MCCKKCIEKRAQRKRERKEIPQIEMTEEIDEVTPREEKNKPRNIDMSGEFDDEDLNDRVADE